MKLKRILATFVCASLICPMAAQFAAQPASAEGLTRDVVIDGDNAQTASNKLYRGQGMISANNSSRLLIDYKNENPEAYWEILNYLFGEDGLAMSHLKLEMGADVNSSSGTEPSVMRYSDEAADVTRGAGYQLAADAKTINPDLTLDMLWWGEPKWISSSSDVYAARYKWYKETLDAAYETYGLKFDYVSASQNERGTDSDWVKYLASHLDSETDCPYDYSDIKIVAGDEVCTWEVADKMLADPELCDAIDVIGSHYTSWASSNAKKLADEYGKEIWFSEASSPMSDAEGVSKYDGKSSGLADIGGALDIANRIITMYPGGEMTLYEYQPAVSAYYDGATYCEKQLITANEPWSGAYTLDSGFYMALHFSQFIKQGWAFVDDACYGDGKAGGDGHAIVDATYSYMTATDTETGDHSTVITNTTDEPITYNFTVENLEKAGDKVYVWQTKGTDGEDYKADYFKKVDEITPESEGDAYTYSVTVEPYSMVTVSTLEVEEKEYTERESGVLSLPYSDDYEYSSYSGDYLSSRGNMPRYTTDEGGAFEVQNVDGNNVVMQMITPDIKGKEWSSSPNPTTNFGDDRWFNYSVSADIKLSSSDEPSKNYAGLGLRYNLAASGTNGYWAKLYENGDIQLMRNGTALETASLSGVDVHSWVNVKVTAVANKITVSVNGKEVISYESSSDSLLGAGRAAYFSSYNNNCFDNFKAEAVDDIDPYITRYDDMSGFITNSGTWEYSTTGSYKCLHRTSSKAKEGATAAFTFNGTGFAVNGASSKNVVLSVKVDGNVIGDEITTVKSGDRELSYYLYGLDSGEHNVEITVKSGTYTIDSIEICSGKTPAAQFAYNNNNGEDNNSSEANSSEDVSSNENASESDVTSSGADVVSSADDNSESIQTSSADSTASDDNPQTGSLYGGAAAVLLAGAAVMIKKREK